MRTMRKVVAGVLVASMMVSGVPVSSVAAETTINSVVPQSDMVEINEKCFPDPVVRELVKGFDTDNDGKLSLDERNSITSIVWKNKQIRDVKGLDYFGNLQYLDLELNYITSIDTGKWSNLQILYLQNNQIASLDVSSNTKLEILSLLGNYECKSITVNYNENLKQLDLTNTSVTSLTLPTKSALQSLLVNNNPKLMTIVYPKTPSGAALTIDASDLYNHDVLQEKGKHVEWTIAKDSSSSEKLDSSDNSKSAYGYTATAKWELNTYNIEYNLSTAISFKEEPTKEGKYGQEITLPTKENFSIADGYQWKGITTSTGTIKDGKLIAKPEKNETTIVITPKVEKIVPQEEVQKNYNITLEKGDGEVKGSMDSRTGKTGTYFVFPTCDYIREGYTFTGWLLDSNERTYKAGASVSLSRGGDYTATAQWKPNEGSIKIGSKEISIGQQNEGVYTIQEQDLQPEEKEGYQFIGWLYGNKIVRTGDEIQLNKDGENIELTPKYTPNKYFVEYQKDNGEIIETKLLDYDSVDIAPSVETKSDYVFVGWRKTANIGTMKTQSVRSNSILYAGEEIKNLTSMNGETVRLQAVYQPVSQQMVVNSVGDRVYTGDKITIDNLNVTVNGNSLVQGVDYTVTYDNNINVGTATIVIEPTENKTNLYSGVKTTFQIKKGNMDNMVNIKGYTGQFDEQAHSIEVTGYPKDSIVSYRLLGETQWTNVQPTFTVGKYTVEVEITNPNYETYTGSATVEIKEKQVDDSTNNGSDSNNSNRPGGNGSGSGGGFIPSGGSSSEPQTTPTEPTKPETDKDTSEKPSTQKPSKPSTNKGFNISKIGNKVYTGGKVTPKPVVKVGGKKLVEGKDYVVKYKNNNKIGKATATVTGIGAYKGLKTTYTYTILPKKPKMAVKTGKSAMKITTKAQKGTKQLIQYSSDNGKTWKTIKTSVGTKTIKGLKKGTYKVRVRSYKVIKGVAYKSAYTTKTTVQVK